MTVTHEPASPALRGEPASPALSGRIRTQPSRLLQAEVLKPQFDYEVRRLLPHYLEIEKALLAEYLRLGLIQSADAALIAGLLDQINARTLIADPKANMSDIALAIERYVESRLPDPVPAWHVDRSRNDYQAAAQLMFGRAELARLALELRTFGLSAHRRALATVELPMPGQTHFQAAQITSPGFHLAALVEEVVGSLRRLLAVYDEIDVCPLGAGAMAGQELDWDCPRLAELTGFARPLRHALVAVASRSWVLRIAGELALLGVVLSRFATDFIIWGSSDSGFIDLPDEFSGLSSAMPQKKNFTILERIRGRTAHLAAYHADFVLGQRNTPFTNLVEVSKEAGSGLWPLLQTTRSVLRLFRAVIDEVRFQADRLRAAAAREFLGGFTLANLLTLRAGVPYRQAQVVAGGYIVEAMARGLSPQAPDAALLAEVARGRGYEISLSEAELGRVFSVDEGLSAKRTPGSANPRAVRGLLAEQGADLAFLGREWTARRKVLSEARRRLAAILSRTASEAAKDGTNP